MLLIFASPPKPDNGQSAAANIAEFYPYGDTVVPTDQGGGYLLAGIQDPRLLMTAPKTTPTWPSAGHR